MLGGEEREQGIANLCEKMAELSKPGEGNRHKNSVSADSPKQGEFKETHMKAHHR